MVALRFWAILKVVFCFYLISRLHGSSCWVAQVCLGSWSEGFIYLFILSTLVFHSQWPFYRIHLYKLIQSIILMETQVIPGSAATHQTGLGEIFRISKFSQGGAVIPLHLHAQSLCSCSVIEIDL